MGFRFSSAISNTKQILRLQSLVHKNHQAIVPRGHVAIYVGETERKRYVVPLSLLSHPMLQDLLSRAEEEFGIDHPAGGLTIPCNEGAFINLFSLAS